MDIQSEQLVQVRFTVTDGGETYTDALYFTSEELAALGPGEMDRLQRERFDNWMATRTVPTERPTAEAIATEVQALLEQRNAIEARLAEIDADREG